jgi:hypothetical protein
MPCRCTWCARKERVERFERVAVWLCGLGSAVAFGAFFAYVVLRVIAP